VAVGWAAIKAWNSKDPITPASIAEAEHETRLNEKGGGVRSTPRAARTSEEQLEQEHAESTPGDARHG
jgi:hypothetical protein